MINSINIAYLWRRTKNLSPCRIHHIFHLYESNFSSSKIIKLNWKNLVFARFNKLIFLSSTAWWLRRSSQWHTFLQQFFLFHFLYFIICNICVKCANQICNPAFHYYHFQCGRKLLYILNMLRKTLTSHIIKFKNFVILTEKSTMNILFCINKV